MHELSWCTGTGSSLRQLRNKQHALPGSPSMYACEYAGMVESMHTTPMHADMQPRKLVHPTVLQASATAAKSQAQLGALSPVVVLVFQPPPAHA